jgi:2',3'-cyclic-nucleotide 2'-phosphodiesterase (5'-nucleotidase family)
MSLLRRLAIPTLVLLAACATMPPSQVPAQVPAPQGGHFRILQVNDVYKVEGLAGGTVGGVARLRTLRKHLESDGTPVLVLHAGDALWPSVMSKYLQAKPMLAALNLLDGDPAAFDPRFVITFGNHEFEKSDSSLLLARLQESQFQWLATNSRWCHPQCDQPFPSTKDTLLLDLGGTRVGLMGLLYAQKNGYEVTSDVIPAAHAAVDALRAQGARVVIAITHEDMGDDVKLAQQVPGIDFIIGGHDHLFTQQKVGQTWIAKADADVKSAIVYDVNVPATGAISAVPLRIAVDSTVAKDPAVDAMVEQSLSTLMQTLGGNQIIGQTKFVLEGVEPAIRGRETALGNLLADVARAQMQTDVGVINGGGVRINDDIPPGPITSYDMEGIFYYANGLVACRVTGEQLLDMLRNSVSRVDAGDGRFLQVSGIRFRYDAKTFAVEPADVEVGGKPLDLNASYTLATVDYLYLHGTGDGYTLFGDATRPAKVNIDREADFRKMVEAYIRAKGTVDTTIEGRIAPR